MPAQLTLTYRVYAALANLALSLAYAKVSNRLRAQGVTAARARERLGHATLPRPDGPVIWCHAASVGESVSLLALIAQLLADDPTLHVLVTSGTASSAQILAGRLPVRALHQFAPLDAMPALRRFQAHWRPGLAVFVESEIWPQMIVATHAAGIPLALLNARMSELSLRNWGRVPGTAAALFQRFGMIRTQAVPTAAALIKLGADAATTRADGDLKAAAGALPVDETELSRFRTDLSGRPVWLAASTHPGEEYKVLQAHKLVTEAAPRTALILVPRHPERRQEIAELIRDAGFTMAMRSKVEPLLPETSVYLADTLGEMGMWYALCPLVFMGGSFVPVGGHNPFEPAQAGAAILHGPMVANAASAYRALDECGGAIEIHDASATALGYAVQNLLAGPSKYSRMSLVDMGLATRTFAAGQTQDLPRLAADLRGLMA